MHCTASVAWFCECRTRTCQQFKTLNGYFSLNYGPPLPYVCCTVLTSPPSCSVFCLPLQSHCLLSGQKKKEKSCLVSATFSLWLSWIIQQHASSSLIQRRNTNSCVHESVCVCACVYERVSHISVQLPACLLEYSTHEESSSVCVAFGGWVTLRQPVWTWAVRVCSSVEARLHPPDSHCSLLLSSQIFLLHTKWS